MTKKLRIKKRRVVIGEEVVMFWIGEEGICTQRIKPRRHAVQTLSFDEALTKSENQLTLL